MFYNIILIEGSKVIRHEEHVIQLRKSKDVTILFSGSYDQCINELERLKERETNQGWNKIISNLEREQRDLEREIWGK